jgi:hypothetical protein
MAIVFEFQESDGKLQAFAVNESSIWIFTSRCTATASLQTAVTAQLLSQKIFGQLGSFNPAAGHQPLLALGIGGQLCCVHHARPYALYYGRPTLWQALVQ